MSLRLHAPRLQLFRPQALRLPSLGLAMLLAGCAGVPSGPGPGAEGECGFGCVEWVERCDTDPRGQVRCYRHCARTGDTCVTQPVLEEPAADTP